MSLADRGDLIFLIGPRGSGKTTVARILAAQLAWSWVDADEALERRAGRSIRDVFAVEGEAAFRELEASVLRELAEQPRRIIATGGGVVLRPDNRDVLRRGWVVWLTADIDSLWQRLQGDAATAQRRPSLTGLAPREEIAEVLRKREPLYAACANHRCDTTGRAVDEIVAEIVAALRGQHRPDTPEEEKGECCLDT
jgi:shikimate kinase